MGKVPDDKAKVEGVIRFWKWGIELMKGREGNGSGGLSVGLGLGWSRCKGHLWFCSQGLLPPPPSSGHAFGIVSPGSGGQLLW